MPLPVGGGIFAFRRFTPNTPQPPRATAHSGQLNPNVAPSSIPAHAGRHFPVDHRADWLGLIPAHAGSTCRWSAPGSGAWAHPRSRGEHVGVDDFAAVEVGSSPLTRGALRVGDIPGCHDGLIPAHAGSTCPWSECLRCCWAHPRSRGEHGGWALNKVALRGSSPLTRGAQRCPPGHR